MTSRLPPLTSSLDSNENFNIPCENEENYAVVKKEQALLQQAQAEIRKLHQRFCESLLKIQQLHDQLQGNSKSLVTEISAVYDAFTSACENSTLHCQNIVSLYHKQKQFTDFSTSKNLKTRIIELNIKLLQVKEDNDRVRHELKGIEESNQKLRLQRCENKTVKQKDKIYIPYKIVSKLQNTTHEDLLTPEKLNEISKNLDSRAHLWKSVTRVKQVAKKKCDKLKGFLLLRENEKENLVQKYEDLRVRIRNIKYQIEVLSSEQEKHNPNKPTLIHITSTSIHQYGANIHDPFFPYLEQGIFESDEPEDCKQVNEFIKYINQFNSCLESKNYKLAAQLAANSPAGMLRTYNVFVQFRNAKEEKINSKLREQSSSSPLMLFCKALMNTTIKDNILSAKLSHGIIRCAITYQDIMLAKHWLCNKNITLSLPLGSLLLSSCKCSDYCDCGLVSSALNVFLRMEAHVKIVQCYIALGNLIAAANYMKQQNFSSEHSKQLFSYKPASGLFYLLNSMNDKNGMVVLSIPTAVSILLEKRVFSEIIKLIKDVYENGLNGQTLMDCLLNETYNDHMGEEKWKQVYKLCKTSENHDTAEELYACLFTRVCLENATIYCLTDYIS